MKSWRRSDRVGAREEVGDLICLAGESVTFVDRLLLSPSTSSSSSLSSQCEHQRLSRLNEASASELFQSSGPVIRQKPPPPPPPSALPEIKLRAVVDVTQVIHNAIGHAAVRLLVG